ncbi:hypothetical protein HDV00_010447 [Rhizophlyctis rosea]|nr:hypothetical protein HDV00_010447 [Rhizophlyctis rosea]
MSYADPTNTYAPNTHDHTNIDLIRSQAQSQKAQATAEKDKIKADLVDRVQHESASKEERERPSLPGVVGRAVHQNDGVVGHQPREDEIGA